MKRFLNPATYPAIVVFAAAGVFAVMLAYSSYNLFHLSMANFGFLRRHGLVAVMEGGLLQLAQITATGAFALFCFFGFKICEIDLTSRYKNWVNR
jgi:hypothetical protein